MKNQREHLELFKFCCSKVQMLMKPTLEDYDLMCYRRITTNDREEIVAERSEEQIELEEEMKGFLQTLLSGKGYIEWAMDYENNFQTCSKYLQYLWNRLFVSTYWKMRRSLVGCENLHLTFGNIERLMAMDVIPSDEYAMISKGGTFDKVYKNFTFNGRRYSSILYGGRKNMKRKNWSLIIPNLSAIYFFTSLSEFCETVDYDFNKLETSLTLFDSFTKLNIYGRIVLVLTKPDIFTNDLVIRGEEFTTLPLDEGIRRELIGIEPRTLRVVLNTIVNRFDQIFQKNRKQVLEYHIVNPTRFLEVNKLFQITLDNIKEEQKKVFISNELIGPMFLKRVLFHRQLSDVLLKTIATEELYH